MTMADRSTALAALHVARAEVDAKRSKLNKLRGIPGIRVRPILRPLTGLMALPT